jgi:hypothetical protein
MATLLAATLIGVSACHPGPVYKGPSIRISLEHGTAIMPPFTRSVPYQSVVWNMRPGQCRWIWLHSQNDQQTVHLVVCYDGLILRIDPSRYELETKDGSLNITYTPLWERGLTYTHLSSTGYARLHEVDMTVQSLR